jgi:hypothetical protein
MMKRPYKDWRARVEHRAFVKAMVARVKPAACHLDVMPELEKGEPPDRDQPVLLSRVPLWWPLPPPPPRIPSKLKRRYIGTSLDKRAIRYVTHHRRDAIFVDEQDDEEEETRLPPSDIDEEAGFAGPPALAYSAPVPVNVSPAQLVNPLGKRAVRYVKSHRRDAVFVDEQDDEEDGGSIVMEQSSYVDADAAIGIADDRSVDLDIVTG